MKDEVTLTRAMGRRAQAEALLRNEMLVEAFEALDRDYLKAWRATNVRDTDARERLWQAMQLLGKVRQHLLTVMDTGKLAQKELDDIAQEQMRQSNGRQ